MGLAWQDSKHPALMPGMCGRPSINRYCMNEPSKSIVVCRKTASRLSSQSSECAGWLEQSCTQDFSAVSAPKSIESYSVINTLWGQHSHGPCRCPPRCPYQAAAATHQLVWLMATGRVQKTGSLAHGKTSSLVQCKPQNSQLRPHPCLAVSPAHLAPLPPSPAGPPPKITCTRIPISSSASGEHSPTPLPQIMRGLYILFYFGGGATLSGMWDPRFPNQGWNPHPLHSKCRVLTTRPPGKSQEVFKF